MRLVATATRLGRRAHAWICGGLLVPMVVALLTAPSPTSAQLTQTVVDGPGGSGQFGRRVAFLSSGDYVVSDPGYDLPGAADAGAVHLYDGNDHTLISTLTGSTASQDLRTFVGAGFVEDRRRVQMPFARWTDSAS